MSDELIIVGGGVAGLSLAHFLDRKSIILEAQDDVGGLARSYNKNGVYYDVGPHIIFSKNKEVLDFMNKISDNNKLLRSNQILHKGNMIKYPFENFLAQLNNKEEINYCLNTFLNNPYKEMKAENMLAFFLKTFGEGITKLYLQPYNEKIWKFDPSMMDTQMVERIPKPPDQDIIDSCSGKFHEGYLHQLHFFYPKKHGASSICTGLKEKITGKSNIHLNSKVKKIRKAKNDWVIEIDSGKEFKSDMLINCMPLHEFMPCIENIPKEVDTAFQNLKFNSIHIVIINVQKDKIGDHFSITIAQKDIIFHRLNRLNFLGESYCLPDGSSTLMAEVTFQPGSIYAKMTKEEIVNRCIDDLCKLNLIEKKDVKFTDIKSEKYAYPIYDLDNKKNKGTVLSYLKSIGIECCGRFAEFEYINSDQVIDHAQKLANKINLEVKVK